MRDRYPYLRIGSKSPLSWLLIAFSHQNRVLWFARDIGMVRSERVLVNYGEERVLVVDELR